MRENYKRQNHFLRKQPELRSGGETQSSSFAFPEVFQTLLFLALPRSSSVMRVAAFLQLPPLFPH